MATQDNYIKTAFRLPPELHSDLVSAAELKGRSLNAEIIDRLQSASAPPTALTALMYRIATLEVDLQTKRLDTIELAMALRQILDFEITEDGEVGPELAEDLDRYRELSDKFNVSADELDAFGIEQSQKYEALKEAARAFHDSHTAPESQSFEFSDPADDMPASPVRRRAKAASKKQ